MTLDEESSKRLLFYSQLVASIAQLLTLAFLWVQAKEIERSFEAKERPALVFSNTVDLKLVRAGDQITLTYAVEAKNQGSGIAYDVKWRSADQIPPLNSKLQTRE